MRRAVRSIVPGALVLALFAPGPASGQHTTLHTAAPTVPMIDGLGLLDRSGPPKFKVGTYVDYHVDTDNALGNAPDYDLKVLVAGEELFWGEECFWLETTTDPSPLPSTVVATLVSYAIFDTTLPPGPNTHFQRKTIMERDQLGNPIQTVLKRQTKAIRDRNKGKPGLTKLIDTLGTETVKTPAGTFTCIKVREESGVRTTEEVGDSTITMTTREIRHTYHSRDVPITGLVRSEIETTVERKAWTPGRSEEAPSVLIERATATNVVSAIGQGREADVIPEGFRKPIKRSKVAASRKK